jgi:hypothetical protein
MPGAISIVGYRWLYNACVSAVVLFSLACFSASADGAEAQLNSKVPPAKWKAVRLRNLPEGASLGVKVIATGALVVILVNEAELKRYPEPVSPVFQGTLNKSLTFSVVIPDAGNYFIILDNRRGTSEKQVRVLIKAQAPKSRNKPSTNSQVRKEKI